jgi:hypothetical protein
MAEHEKKLDAVLQKHHHLKKKKNDKDKCVELSRVNAEFVFLR